MYINLYGKSLDGSVSIPVLAYKIKCKIISDSDESLDILAQTIINILEEKDKLDVMEISNILGIPQSYSKLVKYEVDELVDNKYIVIDSNNTIEKISVLNSTCTEDYYVLYDIKNKKMLECIIPSSEFKKYISKKENGRNASKPKRCYEIQNYEKENRWIENYKISFEISELIAQANLSGMYGVSNEILLESIENINNPIEMKMLFKAYINKDNEVEYECPFYKEDYSVYIEKYIRKKEHETKLYKILMDDYYDMFGLCREKSNEFKNDYRKIDNDKKRLEYIEKIAHFKEAVSYNSDFYKNQGLIIHDLDKLSKSILKELLERYNTSDETIKKIILNQNVSLNSIEDIDIIKAILKTTIYNVEKGKKILDIVGEKSLVSYLNGIFVSKFIIKQELVANVYEKISNDRRIVKFLNDVWQYRNSTTHNVEKAKHYNPEYDMENMYRERLQEVVEELVEELMYFVQEIKKIK